MTEVVIPLSKTKMVLIVVGAAAFVAASLFLWSVADRYSNALEIECAALAGIVFFGACGVYGCVKLFDTRPGLVIDGEGLVDCSSAVAAGRVPWSDVVGVRVGSINGQRFLTIAVRDPDKYVERARGLKRLLVAANVKMTGTPVNIAATALRIRFDELERLVTDAFDTATAAARR